MTTNFFDLLKPRTKIMNRRSFLKFAGSSGISGLFLTQNSFAKSHGGNMGQNGIAIDKDELEYRNQNRSTVVSQNGISTR